MMKQQGCMWKLVIIFKKVTPKTQKKEVLKQILKLKKGRQFTSRMVNMGTGIEIRRVREILEDFHGRGQITMKRMYVRDLAGKRQLTNVYWR